MAQQPLPTNRPRIDIYTEPGPIFVELMFHDAVGLPSELRVLSLPTAKQLLKDLQRIVTASAAAKP
jgi:hypothetical protein